MEKYVKMETVLSTMRWRGADPGLMKAVEEIDGADDIEITAAKLSAKWIGGEIGHCSVCGHEGSASDIWSGCKNTFCPNCGKPIKV